MKRVIFVVENIQTIDISGVNNESHVGFLYGNEKGYIACVQNSEYLPIRTGGGRSVCNPRLGDETNKELVDVIQRLKNHSNWEVKDFYVFDTRKELFKWLSE